MAVDVLKPSRGAGLALVGPRDRHKTGHAIPALVGRGVKHSTCVAAGIRDTEKIRRDVMAGDNFHWPDATPRRQRARQIARRRLHCYIFVVALALNPANGHERAREGVVGCPVDCYRDTIAANIAAFRYNRLPLTIC